MILLVLRMDSGSSFQTVALQKRNGVQLFWYATLILSASPSQQISVRLQCVEQIALLMEPVCFVAQGGDLERNAASDGKSMQITKDINGVLLTCGYIADDSSKLVLNYL